MVKKGGGGCGWGVSFFLTKSKKNNSFLCLPLVHKHSESEGLIASHKYCFPFASSIKLRLTKMTALDWSNYVNYQIILQRRLGFEAARVAFNTPWSTLCRLHHQPLSFLANVARTLRSYSLSWNYVSSLNPPFLRHQHPSQLTLLSSYKALLHSFNILNFENITY